MVVKDIVAEDFVNYKKPSMFIIFPYCSFKCEKECNKKICQNSNISQLPNIEVKNDTILLSYLSNPIIKRFTWSGLNSSLICALDIKTLNAKSWSPSSVSFLDSNNAVISNEIQSKAAINYSNTQGLITGNTTWGVYSIDWGTDENFK